MRISEFLKLRLLTIFSICLALTTGTGFLNPAYSDPNKILATYKVVGISNSVDVEQDFPASGVYSLEVYCEDRNPCVLAVSIFDSQGKQIERLQVSNFTLGEINSPTNFKKIRILTPGKYKIQITNPSFGSPELKIHDIDTSADCPDFIFIGMRGSGQKFADSPLGPELSSIYEELKRQQPFAGKINFDGVEKYEAKGTALSTEYINAVKYDSVEALGNRITYYSSSDFLQKCPQTKFILAGYSQGAFAVHYWSSIVDKQNSEFGKKLVGEILLADPATPSTGIVPFSRSKEAEELRKIASKFPKVPTCPKLLNLVKDPRVTTYCYLSKILVYVDAFKTAQFTSKFETQNNFKNIPQPLWFNKSNDVVADTRTIVESIKSILIYKKSSSLAIKTLVDNSVDIHSSYCPASSKVQCNSALNQRLVKTSVEYLLNNLKQRNL